LLERIKQNADPKNPFILQRPKRYKNSDVQIRPEELSRAFQDAREKTGIYNNISSAEKPTFHEIRSLGIRLYKNQLADTEIKKLSGHATDEMYQLYLKRHTEQWIIAETEGLNIFELNSTE
jgi:enterobacteria phage integrase